MSSYEVHDGVYLMKYTVDTPAFSDKILTTMYKWCNEEFGRKNWEWDLFDTYHSIYFVNEEDKVKFILRWL